MADQRDAETIRRDIEARQQDLVASIHELRAVLSEKADIRKHVTHAVTRARDAVGAGVERVRTRAKERPAFAVGLVALLTAGVLLVGYLARRRAAARRGWRYQMHRARRALARGTYVQVGPLRAHIRTQAVEGTE